MTDVETTAQFEQRKQQHIEIALQANTEATGASGLNNITLIHEALPELNFSDISIETSSLQQLTKTPFFVSSMTAGHQGAVNINQNLAQACQETGWIMGVGSQRRQLSDPQAIKEWQHIRAITPNVRLLGNIGLTQLITTPIAAIETLVDSLQAAAMIIHTNPLQEAIQPEGTPHFSGGLKALERLCQQLSVPVILKETGCGFSKSTLTRLKNVGLRAVDISGYGGTHWGRIEGQRAAHDIVRAQAAQSFKHWGISTTESLQNAVAIKPDYEIWASGGVRSGLDAAKLIAMGANQIGFAKPMLEAALQGVDAVITRMQTIEYELKLALFCTGSRTLSALKESQIWR